MQKIIGVFFIIVAAVFTGCVTDPAGGSVTNIYLDTAGTVPIDSIQYHEIRIDAFSHFWQTQKEAGDSLGPGLLVQVDTTFADSGILLFDTLVLNDLSYDKTSSLPAHTVESFSGDGPRLVYTPLREPKNFSCFYFNRGKTWSYGESDEAKIVLRSTRHAEIEGEEPVDESMYSYGVGSETSSMESIPCGYLVGKGFYLGYFPLDVFRFVDRAVPGAEFVIRY